MADARDRAGGDERTERREVRSRDPSLSPTANRILTEELRAVTGSDTVEVPAGTPRAADERHGRESGLRVAIASNKIVFGIGAMAAVVIGVVISLVTGSWWLLAVAVAVDAIGTALVATLLLRITGRVEHLSPGAAARLEDEGVGDPDAVFSELVQEYAPDDTGLDERETPAHERPAEASAEQRTAQTPSEEPSRPVGP